LTNAARAVILKLGFPEAAMRTLFGLSFFFIAGVMLAQQGDAKFQSGLQVGELLPGPFDAVNINGKTAKGRQHCLVCDFGLQPVVMVFAQEPAEGKDAPLMSLLRKLDEAVSRHEADEALNACAIFLSPDAQNSADNAGEQDPMKIVAEALARNALAKRLEERAEKLKHVVVAYFPLAGPKDYKINPKAEVTVLVYKKHKVLANFAFPEGKMTADDVTRITKSVDETFAMK
jgi:hypothetical protein